MWIIFVNFINCLCLYCFFTIFQVIIFREKFSIQDISYFLLAFSIPRILFSVTIGRYIAKCEIKNMIILSHTILSLLFFSLFFKQSVNFLLFLTFIFSIFLQIYKISIFSYVALVIEQGKILKMNTYLISTEAFGMVMGAFVGKILIDYSKIYPIFNFISYILSVFLIIICFKKNKNIGEKGNLKIEKEELILKGIFEIFHKKCNRIIFIFIISISFITSVQGVTLVSFVTEILLKNEKEIGTLISFQGIGMILIGFTGEKFLNNAKIKKLYRILAYSCVLAAFNTFAYIFFRNYFSLILFFEILEGILFSLIYSSIYSLTQILNEKNISKVFGIINTIEGFLYVLITLTLPTILNYVNVIYLYYSIGIAFIVLFIFTRLSFMKII